MFNMNYQGTSRFFNKQRVFLFIIFHVMNSLSKFDKNVILSVHIVINDYIIRILYFIVERLRGG